jgi:hypothetical protein
MDDRECQVALKPSPVGGVGAFAAMPMEKGQPVFSNSVPKRLLRIQDVPEEFLKYCIFINDEECLAPERFDRLEAAWFLNHSQDPNIEKTHDGRFCALRFIPMGEELFIDYNKLGEPEHLKEFYYRTADL